MKNLVLFLVFSFVFLSCTHEDATKNEPSQNVRPTRLSYKMENEFVKNYSEVNLIPTCDGSGLLNYSISPELPSGLSINSETGVISGTPTVDVPRQVYTVIVENSLGALQVTFLLR